MPWNLVDHDRLLRFWLGIKTRLADKYDKSGGEITGNAKIDGKAMLTENHRLIISRSFGTLQSLIQIMT